MDPLSIATSVLTLLGACSGVAKIFEKFRDIQNVPGIFCALSNEITDLRLILLETHARREEFFQKDPALLDGQERRLLDLCHGLLERTWSTVHETENLMRNSVRERKWDSKLKLDAFFIAREHRNLVRLQADVREAKQGIQSLCSQLGLRLSAHVYVQVSSILETGARIENRLRDDNPVLLGDHQRIEQKLDQLLELHRALPPPLRSLDTYVSSHSPVSIPHRRRIDVAITRVSRAQRSSGRTCECRGRVPSRGYLKVLLGDLFYGYAAKPTSSHHATSCRYRHSAEMVLMYSFPPWFINYALDLRVRYEMALGLKSSFSVRPILPLEHIIWTKVSAGDVEGLKILFDSGQASPEARNFVGDGLLFDAIHAQNLKSTSFLLDIGVDPNIENNLGRTAYHSAWDQILTGCSNLEWRSRMTNLFPDPDFDELYGFSAIHKAILGIETNSVDHIVRSNPSAIQAPDRLGRSPLLWAALKDDVENMELLLSHKAPVDQLNNVRSSPLIVAASLGRTKAVKTLLRNGANVKLRNSFNRTALLYAAQSIEGWQNQVPLIEALLNAGSEINGKDDVGQTPIYCAVDDSDIFSKFEYLLSRGADPNINTTAGMNVLCAAIKKNRHQVAKVLIERRSDHRGTLDEYGTFIHLIARAADAKMLRLLLDHHFEVRDIDTKDKEGLTPLQVGFKREDIDTEWRDLFMQFLRSIDKGTALPYSEPMVASKDEQPDESDSSEARSELPSTVPSDDRTRDRSDISDDEFVDAVETIESLSLAPYALRARVEECFEEATNLE